MIILSTLEDYLMLFIVAIFGIFAYFAIRVTFVDSFYPQILSYISVTKNKSLRPIFLKLFFGKIIAKKFLSENREEITKLKSFKDWKDSQIIDLFDDMLILGYESAINPLPDDVNCGYLKKPDKNYLQDPNLIDFKFNFVREILGRAVGFPDEEYKDNLNIIKKYIRFCENIVFNNKIIPSIKIINNKHSFPQAKKPLKKVRYFTIVGYPRHPKK